MVQSAKLESRAQRAKHLAALRSRRDYLARKLTEQRFKTYVKEELRALNWAIRELERHG